MSTPVSLSEKFNARSGTVFLSGTQAILRLCLDQIESDRSAGLNTGGFVSGYRGSPLGNLDLAFYGEERRLADNGIVFQPGINEELAATSCWGSQQLALFPEPAKDGVFAVWYGKGPGVDRAGDALKHGNLAGTSRYGGVLVLAGDDHGAKSSTTAHQSEQALIAAMIPVFYPSDIGEILALGRHAIEASRYSGAWAALKCATEVIETSQVYDIKGHEPVFPGYHALPPQGVHIGRGFNPLEDEANLLQHRLPAVHAYTRANRLDRVVVDGEKRGLGIVTAGKAYGDTMQALSLLGIDEQTAADLGVRVYKPALVWPIEPEGLEAFARGHDQILVIEEKRSVMGGQLAEQLFNMPAEDRPRLSGKADPDGTPLLPSNGELTPGLIAAAISARLGMAYTAEDMAAGGEPEPNLLRRTPAYCSGCPHNRSTKVAVGSVAMSGIGCHTMALFMPDRPHKLPTQMGGEGANWIGAAPFSGTRHVFQNLGDGTYFHSGLLAIRAAVAAKVNITYKLLFNDAVAMTGGQPHDGELTVPDIVAQLRAEKVREVVIVTDDPAKYSGANAPKVGAEIYGRNKLLEVERQLRDMPGTTILIYDQACAAEKRRKRRRGTYPDPAKRIVINERICEGCGDCGIKSSCVAIQPLDTQFGRKRQIDQSSCNKDFSCLEGFCPSFVTVLGGEKRKGGEQTDYKHISDAIAATPVPQTKLEKPKAVLVAGIGGTGVVTVGAIMGMAARIDGVRCSVLDITGLSQKNGPVLSHVRFQPDGDTVAPSRIGAGEADFLIGCDLVVAASPEVRAALRPKQCTMVVNARMTATADFRTSPDLPLDQASYLDVLRRRGGTLDHPDATGIAEATFGNSIAANMFLLGYVFQLGGMPLSREAILQAIELNGRSISMNSRAFELGRFVASGGRLPAAGAEAAGDSDTDASDLDSLMQMHVAALTEYQNRAYAERYKIAIGELRNAEDRVSPGQEALTSVAARSLYKLMAYKDEYEVARFHTDGKMEARIAREFSGDYRLQYHFAPPLIARIDPDTGEPRKRVFGQWVKLPLMILSQMRILRGTALDVFGWQKERRIERRLRDDFLDTLEGVCRRLTPDNYAAAIEWAEIPQMIRGFGPVKARNIAAARARTELAIRKIEGRM